MTQHALKTPTLDQQRAAHALQQIRELESGHQDYGHYLSYVSALPATIVMNGLGQALTTLLAKGKANEPHRLLYDHIADWLSQQVAELSGRPNQLIDRLMQANQDVYIHAQVEAMAYLNWLKQFARAYLKQKEGQGG